MTHGFITIATGDEQYYRMAVNLLCSYRYFTGSALPFAVLADRENEYTAEFDDVRLFPEARRNYLDKLGMFDLLPYDVNIFIDADCLAYGDLNVLFDVFDSADDFSCFGRVLPLDDKTGWFEYENLGELRPRVTNVIGLHGGIYYMRRTEKCREVFDTAMSLVPDYAKYKFKGRFATPGDEPLIALGMALCGCRPIPHDQMYILCYWEHEGRMKLSVSRGSARDKMSGQNTILVHFGTRFTKEPLYKKQIADLCTLSGGKPRVGLIAHAVTYGIGSFALAVRRFLRRAWNKTMRILRLK